MARVLGGAMLAMVVVAGSGTPAASVTLVRDGRPAAAIVVSPGAAGNEKLAAEELRAYLRKMSRATVPIVTEAPAAGGGVVRLGVAGSPAVSGWKGRRPASDGFALQTRGATLWIVGGDARGALYGVYQLLDEILGVRWFMPCDLGEDVPERPTVEVGSLNVRKKPAFEAVAGLIWAGGPGAPEWEKRMRASVGPAGVFTGHNWENIIPSTEESKRSHPEWFALVKGKRTHQLCSTNPDVVRVSIEKARAFFDKDPAALAFSLSPNDGDGFCECETCKALDRQYGVTDGAQSDRFVHYANEVLREIEKTHPGKQVGILAYVSHTRPPVSARPLPGYSTLICHTPWDFCHIHSLGDPSCARNRKFVELVKGWRKVCRHIGAYDYYGHYYHFTPWPIVRNIRRDIPLLRKLGVDRFDSETQQHWATQGINFYVAAKLLWDPRRDVDALLNDYHSRFYGKAAGPMRRYWETWEAAMAALGKPTCEGKPWTAIFTAERVAECGRLLDEAERAAAPGRDKVRKRIAFVRAGHRFTEAWSRMQAHASKQEWRQAVEAGDEAIRRVEETAGTEPQAFWIWLVKAQTQHLMAPYRDALAKAGQ